MKKKHISLYVAFVLNSCLPDSVLAENASEQASKIKTLQQVIDKQQKQLDQQQIQLDTQKKDLSHFSRQLHSLSGDTNKSPTTGTGGILPRRNDLQTNRRDDAQPLDDWQGSFAIIDSDTRIKIGGFLELDVIHDSDAIKSKGQFIPATIPTRNANNIDGASGQTSFSISPSRLFIETRTPINQKRIKTFLSVDMYGNEPGVDPELRLRQAYIDLSDAFLGGNLLIGQAWSTATDLESTPDVLDFRGPDNIFGSLVPQIRWTRGLSRGVNLMIAAESPNRHIIEGADSLSRFPDGVIAVTWDSNTFNLMASLVVKDLRASVNNGPVRSALGYGGNISGKIKLPFGVHKNEFLFSATDGKGINSQYQTASADAVYDNNDSSLALLENFGFTLGFVHGWSANLASTVTYCCVEIYNHVAQAANSLQGTEYASANLVWDASTNWLLGIEGLWGKRKDKDETTRDTYRTQLTSRLSF